jgi:DNA-binding response OmpR family regulator
VIILSASQEESLLQEVLDIGAFDVMSKPIDLEELELAVMVKLVLSEAHEHRPTFDRQFLDAHRVKSLTFAPYN